MNLINEHIKSSAKDVGFSLCGVANIMNLSDQEDFILQWIKDGNHASMLWYEDSIAKRLDPKMLLSDVKSIIVCALYNNANVEEPYNKGIAKYALGDDYHYKIKGMLDVMLSNFKDKDSSVSGLCVTDSAAVLEKLWAEKAGIGWIGKNSLITSPIYGSMINLGIILINKTVDKYDAPIKNRCGICERCLLGCPNGAVISKTIDSRRCLSYLTIEHRAAFTQEQVAYIRNSSRKTIFGCDICQDVCPWNMIAKRKVGALIDPIDPKFLISHQQWLDMGSGAFRRGYKTTPLWRCGLKNIKRNILAMGVSSEK